MASDTVWSTATRRAIGAQLIDAAKAAYQVAADLGEDPSNTARSLKRLRDEGAVTCAAGPDGPPLFNLAPGQRVSLLNAISDAQPRGSLIAGQQVLIVSIEDGREGVFADVLRAAARTGEVVWAARIDGAGQYLIVFDRKAEVFATLRLAEALTDAGLLARRIVIEAIIGPDELRRKAAALRLQRQRR